MTDQEFKQLKIEGANIVLLEYPDEKIGLGEVLEVTNNLQSELGQDWQVVAMPDKISVYTFPLQKFLDYLGEKFGVEIMFKKNDVKAESQEIIDEEFSV